IPLFEMAAGKLQQVLGADHPLTMEANYDLALAQFTAGNRAVARALMLQVMGGRRKLFGDRNPATIDAIEALSQVSESSDDIRAVVEVQEQVLDECIRRLGLDHPITLRAQSALGWTLGKSGDHGRARLLLEGALKSSASLGPKNPLVTLCAWNLYIYLDKR